MADKWSAKVNVYTGADAGAATLGTLAAAGAQLRTNTDLIWANQPLRVYANDDVIRSVIGPHGGLYRMVSDADLTLWGGYSDQDALVSLSRADIAGEPIAHIIQLAATSDNWLYAGHVFIDANSGSTGAAGSYNAQVQLLANNATKTVEIQSRIGTSVGAFISMLTVSTQSEAFNFRISDEGGVLTQFSPVVADGASAVAYLFDTSNALTTSGAKLSVFSNNGSVRCSMNLLGGLDIGRGIPTFWTETEDAFAAVWNVALGDPNQIYFLVSVIPDVTRSFANSTHLHYDASQDEVFLFEVQACEGTAQNSSMSYLADILSSTLTIRTRNAASNKTRIELTSADAQPTIILRDDAEIWTTFSPGTPDGAGSIAYLFDTSVSFANNDARLLSLKNNGIEHLRVSKVGGIMVGPNAPAAWGSLPVNGDCFIAISNKALGDPTYMRMELATLNGAASGNVEIMAFEGDATVIVTKNAAPQTQWKICAQDTTNLLSIAGVVASTNRMLFMPQVPDGATAVAYLFSTSIALANAGARIASFNIQGTRKASIDTNGAYFVGTNQVLGARVIDARIDDAINSGDATTDGVIDALRDAAITHGWIAAA